MSPEFPAEPERMGNRYAVTLFPPHLRSLLTKATRQAWQCNTCGHLHIDDAARKLNAYAPEAGASKKVFA